MSIEKVATDPLSGSEVIRLSILPTYCTVAVKEIWGFNRIRTHDLCNTGAMLYRLSYCMKPWLLFFIRSSLIWSLSCKLHILYIDSFMSSWVNISLSLIFWALVSMLRQNIRPIGSCVCRTLFWLFSFSLALREELRPDVLPVRSELKGVEGFDKSKQLKHVETEEKGNLPTKESETFTLLC